MGNNISPNFGNLLSNQTNTNSLKDNKSQKISRVENDTSLNNYNTFSNLIKQNSDNINIKITKENSVKPLDFIDNPTPIKNNKTKDVTSNKTDPRRNYDTAPIKQEKQKNIFEKIIDFLLAPIKWLLGLFGISTSKNSNKKLTSSEIQNGRSITKTPQNNIDTGELGPFSVKKITMEIPTKGGRKIPADIYIPHNAKNSSVIIHSYGLGSKKENHAGTATHYASWGMITVVPKFSKGGDKADKNAKEISDLVTTIKNNPNILPANIQSDPKIGLSGHSFGGLASVLAGTNSGVSSIVTLDPADSFGIGKDFAKNITVPSAFIMGDPSIVNQMSNGTDIYKSTGGNKELIRIEGAQHSDFENNKIDGAKNDANKEVMRQATGFMLYNLEGFEEYKNYATGNRKIKVD